MDDKDDDISDVINNAMSLLPDTKDILDTLHQSEHQGEHEHSFSWTFFE